MNAQTKKMDKFVPNVELLKCVKLLGKKTTDDEKISGLMVLPYILGNSEQPEEAIKYAFDRIEWRFVKRLLNTGIKELMRGSERGEQYILLSNYMVATFVCHGKNGSSRKMLDLLPALCKSGALGRYQFTEILIQNLFVLLMVKDIDELDLDNTEWLEDYFKSINNIENLEIKTQAVDISCGVLLLLTKKIQEGIADDKISSSYDLVSMARTYVLLLNNISEYYFTADKKSQLELLDSIGKIFESLTEEVIETVLSKEGAVEELQNPIKRLLESFIPILQEKNDSERGIRYKLKCISIYSNIIECWPEFVLGTCDLKSFEILLRLSAIEISVRIDSCTKRLNSEKDKHLMPERGDADYFALKTSAIFLNTVLSKSESLETLITQGSGYSFVTLTEKECQQLEVRLQKLVEMLLIQAAGVTVGLVDFVLLCYSKSDYSLTRLLGTNLMETVPAVISLLCNLVNFFASIAESIQSLSQQPDSLAEKDSSEQIGIKCLDLLSLFVDIYNFAIENPRNELLIDMAKNIHQSVGGLNTFFNISSGKNVGGDTDADGGVSRVRFATDINRINMLDVSIVDIFN